MHMITIWLAVAVLALASVLYLLVPTGPVAPKIGELARLSFAVALLVVLWKFAGYVSIR
jgi:uncharacterized membrane protein (DUF4010 family)